VKTGRIIAERRECYAFEDLFSTYQPPAPPVVETRVVCRQCGTPAVDGIVPVEEYAPEEGSMAGRERMMTVQRAGVELSDFAMKIREQHGLSYLEYLSILNQESARVLKFALREERESDEPEQTDGVVWR
jgi:hypothetical protein